MARLELHGPSQVANPLWGGAAFTMRFRPFSATARTVAVSRYNREVPMKIGMRAFSLAASPALDRIAGSMAASAAEASIPHGPSAQGARGAAAETADVFGASEAAARVEQGTSGGK